MVQVWQWVKAYGAAPMQPFTAKANGEVGDPARRSLRSQRACVAGAVGGPTRERQHGETAAVGVLL